MRTTGYNNECGQQTHKRQRSRSVLAVQLSLSIDGDWELLPEEPKSLAVQGPYINDIILIHKVCISSVLFSIISRLLVMSNTTWAHMNHCDSYSAENPGKTEKSLRVQYRWSHQGLLTCWFVVESTVTEPVTMEGWPCMPLLLHCLFKKETGSCYGAQTLSAILSSRNLPP